LDAKAMNKMQLEDELVAHLQNNARSAIATLHKTPPGVLIQPRVYSTAAIHE
jgi:hypothetical protein